MASVGRIMTPLWMLALALVASIPAADCDCHINWVEYGGSCYYGSNSSFSWNGARQICREMQAGADLTSITSEAENWFVAAQFGDLLPWIGLNDQVSEGRWEWTNGEPVTYTSWDAGQPDNEDCDCAYIWKPELSSWDDTYCDAAAHFVCEMESF